MKDLLEFAKGLAKEAGAIVRKNYGKIKTEERKADSTFVTNVDKEVEEFIVSRIKKAYPGHSILAEEGSNEKNKSEYLWVIDPIDGTRNFMNNIPLFGVSIGLIKDKKPHIGAVYFPVSDELFYAEKGKGAYLNGKKISVSDRSFKDCFVGYGCNINKGTDWHMKVLARLANETDRIRMFGCATVNMCYVASGRLDAYIARFGKLWDFAASLVVVEEAGGRITGINGKPYMIDTMDFVVSNGKFHDELIRITKEN